MRRATFGFTIIEVLLTLVLFSSFMMIILREHIVAVNRLDRSAERLERIYELKSQMYRRMAPGPKPSMKKRTLEYPQPEMSVYFETRPISKKSSLAPYRTQLEFFSVRGVWQNSPEEPQSELKLLTLMPLPPKEKP